MQQLTVSVGLAIRGVVIGVVLACIGVVFAARAPTTGAQASDTTTTTVPITTTTTAKKTTTTTTGPTTTTTTTAPTTTTMAPNQPSSPTTVPTSAGEAPPAPSREPVVAGRMITAPAGRQGGEPPSAGDLRPAPSDAGLSSSPPAEPVEAPTEQVGEAAAVLEPSVRLPPPPPRQVAAGQAEGEGPVLRRPTAVYTLLILSVVVAILATALLEWRDPYSWLRYTTRRWSRRRW